MVDSEQRRQPRIVENTEYAAMMRRMVRAHGRRCMDADPEDLAELIELRDLIDEQIVAAVDHVRGRSWALSWADLSVAFGMTRQGTQQHVERLRARVAARSTRDA